MIKQAFFLISFVLFLFSCKSDPKSPKEITAESTTQVEVNSEYYKEPFRPQNHFTPPSGKMGKPNAMLYHDGAYHLFYQNKVSMEDGDKFSWGHAKSSNLIKWEHLPTIFNPGEASAIMAGSVVMDYSNSSGFGQENKPAMIAVYTKKDVQKAAQGKNDFLTQNLAYSLDDGLTWTEYKDNPIVSNPGIKDFMDPKVLWHGPTKKWIMVVSAGNRVKIYHSPDLKEWAYASEFGKDYGSHEGTWERPDLIYVPIKKTDGEGKWVLMVTVNKGEEKGGKSTQYFVGDFDGNTFSSMYPKETVRWMDYGLDLSEMISCSGMPIGDGRKLIFGLIDNTMYSDQLPTESWKGSLSIPRHLVFKYDAAGGLFLDIQPVRELKKLMGKPKSFEKIMVNGEKDLSSEFGEQIMPGVFTLFIKAIEGTPNMALELSNDIGEKLLIGYDFKETKYYVDRSQAGKADIHESFNTINSTTTGKKNVSATTIFAFVDVSGVEVFFEKNTIPMTNLIFPTKPYTKVKVISTNGLTEVNLRVLQSNSMWEN